MSTEIESMIQQQLIMMIQRKPYLLKVLLQSSAHQVIAEVLESDKSDSEVAQSCLTFCDPIDYGLPGSSICGIIQARVLQWSCHFLLQGSSQPRDWTWVSCIVGRRFTIWATREVRIRQT